MNKKLATLTRINTVIAQSLDLSDVIAVALDGARDILRMEAGIIFLRDQTTGHLHVQDHRGLSELFIREYLAKPLPLSDAVFGKVAASGEPMALLGNIADDGGVVRLAFRRERWKSMAIWPLRARERIIGVMAVMSRRAAIAGSADPDWLAALGCCIGMAIENAQRYAKAQTRMKALERQVTALKQKNNELESFIYTLAHDLKSPLVSLRGYAIELMRECSKQLAPNGQFYISRIEANAGKMEQQIQDLLQLSRVKRIKRVLGPVDVQALVGEILEEMDYQIAQTGAHIRLVNLEHARVHSQRNLLKQVLMNLVDNALKYQGSDRTPRIEIGLEDAGRHWVLFVRDNGIGIAPDAQQRIFNCFEQIPEARKLNPGGTGVGLAIVKKIIEYHRGRVWVTSEPGCGSTFYCALPKTRAPHLTYEV